MTKERDFTDVLTDMDDGKVHEQLTKFLRQLAQQVADTGKAGTLILKIKAKLDGRVIVLSAEPRVTLPQPATGSTYFFAMQDGSLTREDPLQQPLRNLETKAPTPLRTVKQQPEKPTEPEAPKGA